MKSYNHLWEEFISDENIKLAIQNSSRGKRDRTEVRLIYNDQETWIPRIREYAEHFYNMKHTPKEINDGISQKRRTIIVPKYWEQVIHHMAVNVLKPIYLKGMYEHSYGSLPDKGVHKAKAAIEKWIRKDKKNTKYYLKMDVKKYFNSIPHNRLNVMLSELIHDKKFLSLLITIISVTDVGIPLGFYTSQWFANWYLEGLDHYIKEQLKAVYYVRYMDDMVIFGPNKRKLHQMRKDIEQYLNVELGLKMKENWQVERFSHSKGGRDLDFMGFRFFYNRTTLRKSILYKASRKARRISKKYRPTVYDCRQMLSYAGWFGCTDTYGAYLKWIKPYINFHTMKRQVSRYDKGVNRCGTKQQIQTQSNLK